MFRWLGNRLAGRKYVRSMQLLREDIPRIIAQMAGNNVIHVGIEFDDHQDSYVKEALEDEIDALREIGNGNRGSVQSVRLDEYIGRESLKRYVTVRTPKVRADINYVLEAQKKEETTPRSALVDAFS